MSHTNNAGDGDSVTAANIQAAQAIASLAPYYPPQQHGHDGQQDDRHEQWSGAEDDDAEDDDDGEDESSPKRKRQKTSGAGHSVNGSRPMSVSCEKCKERKVKCDRAKPSCGWCVKNNTFCQYKERKKPGLRAGYGRELEARLDRLENVLQSQQHVLRQLANAIPGGQTIVSPVAQPRNPSTQAEAALFMQTPGMFPSNSPGGGRYDMPQPQTHGDSQHSITMTPASTSDVYQHAIPSPNVPGPREAPTINSSVQQDQDFPPYDLLYALTDLYFKHVNQWCPILHRRTTLDLLFGSAPLEEADRVLLHAIMYTTLRFSSDPRLTPESRAQYQTRSRQKVLLYGIETSSVKSLQALVIVALDSSNGPSSWNLLALISRTVIHLGLAVESTSASVAPAFPSIYTLRAMVLPPPQTFIEDESRRRTFWMVYLLDRYATISTAFEFALDDKEIDRKLPAREEIWTRNQHVNTRWFATSERTDYSMNYTENLGALSYYIEVIGILSKIHRFLKKPVDIGSLDQVSEWQQSYRDLDNNLNQWKFSLPSEFGNMSRLYHQNPNPNGIKLVNSMWIMLHCAYHTAIVRLHSSAAYPTTRSPIFTPSYSASQRCLAAVEDICAICTYVRTNNLLPKLGPPFAFTLWVAARLLLVHGSTIDHKLNPSIHPLVETLRQLGTYWKASERYATLLTRVLEEYAESENAVSRETPSTVKILADMRRTAFDLDFLISRQPRQYFEQRQLQQNQPTPQTQQQMSVGGGAGAGGGGGGGEYQTPAVQDLEYLDLFGFFNMPRVMFPATTATGDMTGTVQNGEDESQGGGNGFNIVNFEYDADADFLLRENGQ